MLEAARTLIEQGVGLVAVSMGADGALFVERGAAVLAIPPAIVVKSTVGAGDAMVAGIVTGTLRGLDLAGRARLATAFSLGALGEVGPNLPGQAVIESFAARVTIQARRVDRRSARYPETSTRLERAASTDPGAVVDALRLSTHSFLADSLPRDPGEHHGKTHRSHLLPDGHRPQHDGGGGDQEDRGPDGP